MGAPLVSIDHLVLFTLILLRISAIFALMPVIGDRVVPVRVKAGLALLTALIVFPAMPPEVSSRYADVSAAVLFAAMAGEVLIGVLIGFAVRIVFAGIQFAGNMIGLQMGLAIANVFDPVSSSQVSIMAEFQYLFAMLIYLAVDAHHLLIFAMVDSFRMVPPLQFRFSASLMQFIVLFSNVLFVTAVKICAPIMAVLLFSNVALGIVARTVPQINIFIVGMPLQIAIGLIMLGLTIPYFASAVQRALGSMAADMIRLLRLM